MSSDNRSGEIRQAIRDRIAEERANWESLVAEVDPDWVTEPGAMGEWSFKDAVAHIAGWRQRWVDELVATVQGTPIPTYDWPYTYEESEEQSPEGDAKTEAINEWLFDQSRKRTYDQVLAQISLQSTTMQAAVDLMPDELIEGTDTVAGSSGRSLVNSLRNGDAFSHYQEEHEPEIRAWLDRRRTGEVSAESGSPATTCGECGGAIEQDDLVCPHCGISLISG
jgi:hypothetical protein